VLQPPEEKVRRDGGILRERGMEEGEGGMCVNKFKHGHGTVLA
jgi:hypothetical protein